MPEATAHEHGDLCRRKDDIGFPSDLRKWPPVNEVPQTLSVQNLAQSQLGCCVPAGKSAHAGRNCLG
jgi:hypothetical protein